MRGGKREISDKLCKAAEQLEQLHLWESSDTWVLQGKYHSKEWEVTISSSAARDGHSRNLRLLNEWNVSSSDCG